MLKKRQYRLVSLARKQEEPLYADTKSILGWYSVSLYQDFFVINRFLTTLLIFCVSVIRGHGILSPL